jgi:RimJ/RimL family protein N-acetyltransferase
MTSHLFHAEPDLPVIAGFDPQSTDPALNGIYNVAIGDRTTRLEQDLAEAVCGGKPNQERCTMNLPAPVQIKKAARVEGKTLHFRDARVDDAAFIFSLRTDVDKSRYLSPVSGEVAQQEEWLQRYSQADDQAYFVIECQDVPIGTVRLYDAQGDSFCWGSWVLQSGCASHIALESALMVYSYAIDHLGFCAAHFDVRKGNERVWQFHERFGSQRLAETEHDYLYQITGERIAAARQRYRRFLDGTVTVHSLAD